jgi:DNA-binding NarL/FixJ family response regulator
MRVLLADDHDLVRDAVKTYIEAIDAGASVETAANLEEALAIAEKLHPYDLILLDWRMPGMNDGEGLKRMIRARPEVPVAVLSGSTDRQTILAALDCGAASFIPKTLTGRRLLGVLELVTSGETYVPVSAVTGESAAGGEGPSGGGRSDAARAAELGLTERETEVLSKLMAGLSNKEIARALGLQEVTIKLHMRGLFRKLHAKNRTQVVRTALDLGLAC